MQVSKKEDEMKKRPTNVEWRTIGRKKILVKTLKRTI
jgi:hypothetical protein